MSEQLPTLSTPGSGGIPVWIVDNNRNFCLVLSEALNRTGRVDCSRYFFSSLHAIHELQAGAEPPAVILLDIKMPEMTGVEAITPLRKLAPSAKIIMLTSYDLDRNIKLSLAKGASGYLLKSSTPGEIVQAIESAEKGGAPIDPFVTRRMVRAFAPQPSGGETYDLSPREREILRLVAEGMGSNRVAERLGISRPTVDTHVRNIFEKLGVHNRHAMVAKAVRERLI